MKTMMLVLTVVLAGSLAAHAAGPIQFNFSFDGFCDQMETTRYSPGDPVPMIELTGIHDFVNCFGTDALNVGVAGLKHSVPTSLPPNMSPLDDFGDPFLGFAYTIPYNLQYLVHEPTTANPACVWANYEGTLGLGNFFIQQGTCTKFAAATKKGRTGPPTTKR